MTTAAWAANNGYHGSLCTPAWPDDVGRVAFNRWGVSNLSDDESLVACGASPAVSSNVTKVEVVVYDKQPAADVCCTIYIQDAAGEIITSAKKCSAGFGNSAQTLSYSPPVNTVGTLSMLCSIPAKSPVNGVSRVTSYRVETTP
jgi:hypothetical protein